MKLKDTLGLDALTKIYSGCDYAPKDNTENMNDIAHFCSQLENIAQYFYTDHDLYTVPTHKTAAMEFDISNLLVAFCRDYAETAGNVIAEGEGTLIKYIDDLLYKAFNHICKLNEE